MRKFGLVATTLLVVIAVAVIVWAYSRVGHGAATPTPTPAVMSITKDGAIACLPNKDRSGPHTLECALGIQADDHAYYSLKNLPDPTLPTGARVRVEGVLTAPSVDNRYDIRGAIDVSKITLLK